MKYLGRISDPKDLITKEYADGLLAPTELNNAASQAYAIGDYFIYSNTLHRATAAIASGGTITPNGNCVAVTVGEELESLKTSVSSGKALVAAAVTDMGVPTAANATFQIIANNVRAIGSGAYLSIIVEAPTGSTITAVGTKSATVYNGAETSTGHYVIPVTAEDTYTVTCVYGVYSLQNTVIVAISRTAFATYAENDTLYLLNTDSVENETLYTSGTVVGETLYVD